MNRRSFIHKLSSGLFAFSILPAAETYERIWRPKKEWIVPIIYKRPIPPDDLYINLPYWIMKCEQKVLSDSVSQAVLDAIYKKQNQEQIFHKEYLGEWSTPTTKQRNHES